MRMPSVVTIGFIVFLFPGKVWSPHDTTVECPHGFTGPKCLDKCPDNCETCSKNFHGNSSADRRCFKCKPGFCNGYNPSGDQVNECTHICECPMIGSECTMNCASCPVNRSECTMDCASCSLDSQCDSRFSGYHTVTIVLSILLAPLAALCFGLGIMYERLHAKDWLNVRNRRAVATDSGRDGHISTKEDHDEPGIQAPLINSSINESSSFNPVDGIEQDSGRDGHISTKKDHDEPGIQAPLINSSINEPSNYNPVDGMEQGSSTEPATNLNYEDISVKFTRIDETRRAPRGEEIPLPSLDGTFQGDQDAQDAAFKNRVKQLPGFARLEEKDSQQATVHTILDRKSTSIDL